MDKMKMESSNLADEKFEQLKALFPNVVTETIVEGVLHRAIDKDKLMQEINAYVLEGLDERYNFTWPDKRKSVVLANEPTRKTLRPCRQESVNFDETENLYIEGDNLEVLKLLRHTYMGKIKMIYIDPPYNTGKDFLYKDNFYIDKEEYDENSGQYDEDGNLLFSNTESNGRYHTDWLNMMYPRLRMARDLLTEDGAIFISIDDNEVSNLKKICDEIFGERNFIAKIVWANKEGGGSSDSKHFRIKHEYILVYGKIKELVCITGLDVEDIKRYTLEDEFVSIRGKYQLIKLSSASLGYVKSLDYPINAPDGTLIYPNEDSNKIKRWRWSEDKLKWGIKNGFVEIKKDRANKWQVYTKQYLNCDNEGNIKPRTLQPSALIEKYSTTQSNKQLEVLLGKSIFSYSKPVELIKLFLKIFTFQEDIILDFFSGSSTTAHAVMELNAEDGGNRKFIMVQLPEEADKKSEAYKAGYKNICEIGKERIRRAGAKIKEENPESSIDTGFKVFKLDSSNMEDVYYKAEELTQIDISKTINNLKEDRTEEDLLYSIMLEIGVLLTSKIVKDKYNDSEIYFVDGNYIIACFDRNIKEDTITYIAEQQPSNIVLNQHVSDSLLTNIEQIFKKISAYTIIRMI